MQVFSFLAVTKSQYFFRCSVGIDNFARVNRGVFRIMWQLDIFQSYADHFPIIFLVT